MLVRTYLSTNRAPFSSYIALTLLFSYEVSEFLSNFIVNVVEVDHCIVRQAFGDFVEEGQVLGRITDVFGNTLTTYYAEQTGVILYVCPALASPKGTILVAYGTINEFDDEE